MARASRGPISFRVRSGFSSTPPMNPPRSDYRESHLCKGEDYDDELSANAWEAYTAAIELTIIDEVIIDRFSEGPRRCMDFACGTGRLTCFLQERVPYCLGVDISSSMLAVAKVKCDKSYFLQCDLTRHRVSIGLFDLITAFRFFGNAQDALRVEVLSVLNNYLMPDGILVLNNHRNPHAVRNLIHRCTGGRTDMDLTLSKLQQHTRACKFRVVEIYGVGAWSVRHRWTSWVTRPSKTLRTVERMTRSRVFARFAPDMVVVLRKS